MDEFKKNLIYNFVLEKTNYNYKLIFLKKTPIERALYYDKDARIQGKEGDRTFKNVFRGWIEFESIYGAES